MKGISFLVSFGKWGGISFHNGYTKRLCLGWVSFVVWPFDLDVWVARMVGTERAKDR